MYRRSVDESDAFWAEVAERITWFKKWDKVQDHDFKNAKIRWFDGGKLNLSYNCLDRHLETEAADKVAFYWEGDSPEVSRTITYRQLWAEVAKFANVLRKKGVKKGDRVTIYLPMIPELPVAMLACARIGAIHSVVFGGFSADALRDRILDCESTVMITADGGLRGSKSVPLKSAADEAMATSPSMTTCIVVRHTGLGVDWVEGRDVWYHDEMAADDITTDVVGRHLVVIPDVATLDPVDAQARVAHDDARGHAGTGRHGLVGRGLQGDALRPAQSAVGGDHDGGFTVEDAVPQRVRGEAAEHHAVDGSDARTGQHGHGQFGNHRQVDGDPVALLHTFLAEDVRESCHVFPQLPVSDGAANIGGVALPVEGDLVGDVGLHMPVEAVVAEVELSSFEPTDLRVGEIVVLDRVPFLEPD